MGATGAVWLEWLRRRWAASVVLVVLVALGVGLGLAAIAGGRRSASAYGRVLDAARVPDVVSGHGRPPAEAAAEARQVAGVRDAATDVGFTASVVGYDPLLVPYYIGAYDNDMSMDRQVLTDGRYPRPDRADEILITSRAADKAGFAVGDRITIGFATPTSDDEVRERFTIVGIGHERREVVGDAALARDSIRLTRAFTRSHLPLMAWSRTTFMADDVDTMTADLVARGYPVDETRAGEARSAQDALRPLVLTIVAIGLVALVATALVAHQALAREAAVRHRDHASLSALGMSRRQLRTVDLLALLTVVVPGLALGAVVAVAVSPAARVGRVRTIDPSRGLAPDWLVVGGGVALIGLVLAAAYLVAAQRGDRPGAPPSIGAVQRPGPVPSAGIALAVGQTPSERRGFWTTVVLTTLAITMIVSALTFVAGLDRLTDSPAEYGFGWDLVARNAYGEIRPDEVAKRFGGDPRIDGVAAGSLRNVVLGKGLAVPAMAVADVTETFWPTVADGRVPTRDDEILLGGQTMHDLGVGVGDRIRIRAGNTNDDRLPTASATVVGRAVFAPIELAGFVPPRLDVGAAMTSGLQQRLVATLPPDDPARRLPDLVYFDLAPGVDPASVISRYPEGIPDVRGVPTEWLSSVAPAEVIESRDAVPLLWAALVPLALVVLATLAHTQLTVVRTRRADYAVLKAMGFTRRQVLATVACQATATLAVPLVAGVLLGVAAGRLSWTAFARLIGVIDIPVVPVLAVAATALAALLVVNLVCLVPAALAASIRPGSALHAE